MALKSKPDRFICFNLCVCKSIVFLIVLTAPFIISDSLTFLLPKSNSQGLLSLHFFIMHSLKLLTFGIGMPLFEMCCVHMGIACFFFVFFWGGEFLPRWFGALSFHIQWIISCPRGVKRLARMVYALLMIPMPSV